MDNNKERSRDRCKTLKSSGFSSSRGTLTSKMFPDSFLFYHFRIITSFYIYLSSVSITKYSLLFASIYISTVRGLLFFVSVKDLG